MKSIQNEKFISLIKINLYFLFFIAAFFIFDIYITSIFMTDFSIFNEKTHILFTLFWSICAASIIFILPKKTARVFGVLLVIVLILLFLTQTVYCNMFNTPFSFFNLKFAGEAMPFLGIIFSYIPFDAVLCIIFFCILILSAIFILKQEIKNRHLFILLPAIPAIAFYFMAVNYIDEPFGYLQKLILTKNRGKIAANFLSMPNENLELYGFYQFSFLDFIKSNSKKSIDTDIDLKINEYINSYPYSQNNAYSNLLKDKNLILILIESGDSIVLNAANTPTLARLMQEGLNFKNHFSSSASGSGPTFNAELTVNTGFYSPAKSAVTANDLGNNYFPYALPNLFKNVGYKVNSFHMNTASFYNRGAMHKAWGYLKYYSLADLGYPYNEIKNDTLFMRDETMLNAILPKEGRFLSFIISYTGHAPYTINGIAVDLFTESEKEAMKKGIIDEGLTALSAQLRETDNFFAMMLNEMEKRNLIDNTVIIGFTDHYAYGFPSKEMLYKDRGTDDPNFLNHTPFFIWSKGLTPQEINKVSTTIDIYPTIINLFGLKKENMIYMGTDIFSDKHRGIVFFDNGWYTGNKYYNSSLKAQNIALDEIEKMSLLKKSIEETNNAILMTDYFRNKIN